MAEEEVKVERPKSLAEQIKEGAKSAGKAPMSFEDLDGASKAAVVLLSVGAEVAAVKVTVLPDGQKGADTLMLGSKAKAVG